MHATNSNILVEYGATGNSVYSQTIDLQRASQFGFKAGAQDGSNVCVAFEVNNSNTGITFHPTDGETVINIVPKTHYQIEKHP